MERERLELVTTYQLGREKQQAAEQLREKEKEIECLGAKCSLMEKNVNETRQRLNHLYDILSTELNERESLTHRLAQLHDILSRELND